MINDFHKGLVAVGKVLNVDIRLTSKRWMEIYRKRKACRGKADAVKFMKELNTAAERYALYQPIESIPWTKSGNDGFPKILNFCKEDLRSKEIKTVVMTLSVFRSVEAIRLPISKDISTVLAPCNADISLMASIIDFIPSWLERIPPLKLPKTKYHFTLKNGPNGHALKTSDIDISVVMEDQRIYGAIRTVEGILKGSKAMEKRPGLNKPQSCHSKLTQFPEKAGKTRTIAIIDYYSQKCLKPLHEGLMEILGKLVSDGTYSHQRVGKFVQQATKDKSFIGCCDLTAATDRFPALIQEALLHGLLKDPILANAMWTLLAKRTFRVAWSGEEVSYQCGQPMGAYASWPLFALAHHLIVEYCAYIAGVPDIKTKYRIIGDDNAITDERVYDVYLSVMTRLGLTINPGKTTKSIKSADKSAAEVAKQIYLNGKNLTPLTPGFIRDIKKPYMFNTCMGVLLERYEFIEPEHPTMLIDALFRKEKTRQTVWALASNPITGNIMPSKEGCYAKSVWDPEESGKTADEWRELYHDMIIKSLIDEADRMIDESLDMMSSESYDTMLGQMDLSDPLALLASGKFDPKAFRLSGPWKDTASQEPACYSSVRFAIEQRLTEVQNKLSEISLGEPVENILALIDFVPNPRMPYMDRKEMRQKRLSSSILKLLDYNDDTEFVVIKW